MFLLYFVLFYDCKELKKQGDWIFLHLLNFKYVNIYKPYISTVHFFHIWSTDMTTLSSLPLLLSLLLAVLLLLSYSCYQDFWLSYSSPVTDVICVILVVAVFVMAAVMVSGWYNSVDNNKYLYIYTSFSYVVSAFSFSYVYGVKKNGNLCLTLYFFSLSLSSCAFLLIDLDWHLDWKKKL